MSTSTAPTISRTFDACPEAPVSWLVDAFLLSVGRADPEEREYRDERHGERIDALTRSPYRYARPWRLENDSALDDPTRSIDVPGFEHPCPVETLSSRSAVYGEPHMQIVGEDESGAASADWQTAMAPLRRADLQRELTRQFGLVMPEHDDSPCYVASRDLNALLRALPPERRLALQAHLADSGILDPAPMDAAHAAELLTGLHWLVERLGPDGIEEDESGELPIWFAREAEAALGWEATSQSPPSPGHALIALARSTRFVRRLRGHVIPTARTRTLTDKPVRAVAEIRDVTRNRGSSYGWGQDHARTLALLAIADGSAFDAADAVQQVIEGLRLLTAPSADDREDGARNAVLDLMEVLAPLGGPGAFGRLTPAVRAFARDQLSPRALSEGW